MITQKTLEEAAVALLSRTLHISTTQSTCGACGRHVSWTEFTPRCRRCGAEWLFVTAGFIYSGWSEDDYQARCEELAPGLRYLKKGEGLGIAAPSPGWLKPPLRVYER